MLVPCIDMHIAEEDKSGCFTLIGRFTLIIFLVPCGCRVLGLFLVVPWVGLQVYDCRIFRSYSLTFCVISNFVIITPRKRWLV